MSSNRPGPAAVQCPHCGKMLNEDDLYCRYCGRPMVKTGFDEPQLPEGEPPIAGRGVVLRGIGERPTLSDPLASSRPRGGVLNRFNTGSLGCAGLVGILIAIVVVIGLITWFVLRPRIADDATTGVHTGLARELAADNINSGTNSITLDESDINAHLDADDAWFDPLSDLELSITETGLKANFTLYGLSGNFSSGITVQDGQIRLIDPNASGAGGRLVKASDLAHAIEQELANFLLNENRPVSTVALADGTLSITFAPTA